MKSRMFVAGFVVIALMISLGAAYAAPDSPGAGTGGWYCPWKVQGRMMHNGPGWGCPMAGRQGAYQQNQGQPLTKEQAKQLVEDQLQYWNNPNLKLGDFGEKEGFYEGNIVTKDGSLVQKVHVDKNTGWFRNVY